jgi:hypothetical protein
MNEWVQMEWFSASPSDRMADMPAVCPSVFVHPIASQAVPPRFCPWSVLFHELGEEESHQPPSLPQPDSSLTV